MQGQDVSGEAGGAAHPPGTASIPAGVSDLRFLQHAHTCDVWFTAKRVPQQPSGSLRCA